MWGVSGGMLQCLCRAHYKAAGGKEPLLRYLYLGCMSVSGHGTLSRISGDHLCCWHAGWGFVSSVSYQSRFRGLAHSVLWHSSKWQKRNHQLGIKVEVQFISVIPRYKSRFLLWLSLRFYLLKVEDVRKLKQTKAAMIRWLISDCLLSTTKLVTN